jgi:hypothetical protein
MQWTTRLLSIVIAAAAATCAGEGPAAPPKVFFPTVPIGDAYPAALINGFLEMRTGCVFVTAHGDRSLLLWPEGYTARLSDGQLQVLDGDGTIVGREGEPVRLGGGETNPLEVGGAAQAEHWHPS